MIKVIGYSKEEVKYLVIYNKSAGVLNIESTSMCDDSVPYRESTGCMIWLNSNNTIGEIECIFPVEINNADSIINENIKQLLQGTPKLNVNFEEKPVEIFFSNSQLILIFNNKKKADGWFISSNIKFYISDDELIAIACTDFKLI